MSEWISVRDRLPEKNTIVLVFDISKTISEKIFVGDEGRFSEYAWESDTAYTPASRITHWMPLPEPPPTNPQGSKEPGGTGEKE